MRAISNRDIRSLQFRGANLNAGSFQGVRAGHQTLRKAILMAVGILSVVIIGALSILPADILNSFVTFSITLPSGKVEFPPSLVCLGLFYYLTILIHLATRGFAIEIIFFLVLQVLLGIGILIFEQALEGTSRGIGSKLLLLGLGTILSYSIAMALGFLVAFVAICSGIYGELISVVIAIASATSLPTLAIALGRNSSEDSIVVILAVPIVVVVVGEAIARQTIKGSSNFVWVRNRVIFRAATGATSFYNADLSDACFDEANLKYTDFRRANLTRTSFQNVKGLELARIQGTILEDPKIRELLTDRSSGLGQNFTDANLRGANLRGANLGEAVLVRSQLLDADLSGANLTDACIQDWNINHNTRFTDVECKRVYLKCSPNGHFLEPKPDSGEFLPGEFEKWVTDIRDTIDLIFQNGLNWRAFAFSLTQTAIDHEGLDLSVRSIENKGDGVVVAKVGVSLETNKTAIHRELTETYQGAVGAIEAGYELVLKAKDGEIARLTQFCDRQQQFIQGLVTGIAETKAPVVIQGEGNRVYLMDQAGDIMENSNQNVSAGGNVDMSSGARVSIGGDMTGSTVNLGELSGQVSNTIQQLRNVGSEGEELAKILAVLQETIDGDRLLSSDQKQQALEAVATLAEEGSKPRAQRLPKFCSMALNALKGVASAVTDASKLASALQTCLPALTGLLGL